MTDQRAGIEHSPVQKPTIFWTDDSVFVGDYTQATWKLWKITYLRWNKHCKAMRMLDSSGKSFVIDHFDEVSPSSRIAAFLRRHYWMTWVKPVIVSETQLSLEDFKKEVFRAVNARHRHDRDSLIVNRTMEKLPRAKTYLEAIESLPELL